MFSSYGYNEKAVVSQILRTADSVYLHFPLRNALGFLANILLPREKRKLEVLVNAKEFIILYVPKKPRS